MQLKVQNEFYNNLYDIIDNLDKLLLFINNSKNEVSIEQDSL